MLGRGLIVLVVAGAGWLLGQEETTPAAAPKTAAYVLDAGTKVPLSLINSISTKHSAEGDRVYLETACPVRVNGKIVVPVGSDVPRTVTQIKKPGRVKGSRELYFSFDSL